MFIYHIDDYTVKFVKWHSEIFDDDFIAITLERDGKELLHSGKSKLKPSLNNAISAINAYETLSHGFAK